MPEPSVASVHDLLKREEGFRGRPYKCPAGATTIGFGHNLTANEITRDDANHILETDVCKAENDAAQVIGDIAFRNLDPVRQAVLTSMAFQMGRAGLAKFHATLACVDRGDYDKAADNMLRSKWATQTPRRAKRHAQMMLTGQWPKPEEWT